MERNEIEDARIERYSARILNERTPYHVAARAYAMRVGAIMCQQYDLRIAMKGKGTREQQRQLHALRDERTRLDSAWADRALRERVS